MTDRPIIFSAPMIKAILRGQKTQTRRVIAQPDFPGGISSAVVSSGGAVIYPDHLGGPGGFHFKTYAPGDRLYVREALRAEELDSGQDGVRYRADNAFLPIGNDRDSPIPWLKLHNYREGPRGMLAGPWVPPIHAPRWTSSCTLDVALVRVERLQDISHDDAVAEGMGVFPHSMSAVKRFRELWDHLNGKPGRNWECNPWVVAVTFTPHQRNIDDLAR